MRRLGKFNLSLVVALLFSVINPTSAHAAPLAPGFESVTLALITDNDFAVWMGDDKNVTRLFWQNDWQWPQQIAEMATQDVVPQIGETYIYLLAMGGNNYTGTPGGPGVEGWEDWAGAINGKSLIDYPGAQVAVARSTPDDRDINLDGYLLLNNYLSNWYEYYYDEKYINGLIEPGIFSATLSDVSAGLENAIWSPATESNHPAIAAPVSYCYVSCSVSGEGFIGKGWDFPDGSAVVFRFPLSAAQLPVSASNGQVVVDWKDPMSGETPVDYLVDYKESSEGDSAYKSFSVVNYPITLETITGLTNGTPYTFRVAGRNANGIGEYSVSRSVTPVGPPTRPLNLSYTALDTAVSVKFTTPENSGGFSIANYEFSTDNGSSWTALSPPSVSNTITIGDLTNSSPYQIKIRAVTPYGSGAASTALTATPGVTVNRTVTYSSGTLDTVTAMSSGGTFTEAETFTVGAAPTRSNFRFMGWSDGTTTFQPGATYTVAQSNVNLTAQWRQSSLAGTSNSDIARVLTWNIVGSEAIDSTVSSDSGHSSVRVVIPANSFDPGTEVIFWRLTNQNLSKSTINNSYDYLVNFAISWSIGDDISEAKRVLTARSPIQITIKNSSIQKGASAWMILGGVATPLGAATQDGEISVSITEDPIITLANLFVVGNNSGDSLEAARLAQEKAKAQARAEILRLIKEGKSITVKLLNTAELDGSTDKNILQINADISGLPEKDKESISSVVKILFKFYTANKIANGSRVSFSDLQSVVGSVKSDPAYKSAFYVGLRNASSEQLDTVEKIQSFVLAIEKGISDRKADFLARISKIRTSILR
jgi:uncharacterized repeat protein (TIGR02543 family)